MAIAPVQCLSVNLLKIFSCETTGPIQLKFQMDDRRKILPIGNWSHDQDASDVNIW